MAMTMLLRRMKDDATVHSLRSGFRDWTAECTCYVDEVAEIALAHTIEKKVERAYRPGDLFEKRRRLMDDWATYCASNKPAYRDKVRPIRPVGNGAGKAPYVGEALDSQLAVQRNWCEWLLLAKPVASSARNRWATLRTFPVFPQKPDLKIAYRPQKWS